MAVLSQLIPDWTSKDAATKDKYKKILERRAKNSEELQLIADVAQTAVEPADDD